ncbi:DUF3284 domain-containing protein [Lactobacillus acetotolerans]|uniref:DUF3284 domain-containing protein n=1 Tax=Lactobacillus acetotolerans TaxID=1600 RepID=UPI001F0F3E10|nr:DUF3284 domain-containing protein [Lactobacillus acetotolerans]
MLVIKNARGNDLPVKLASGTRYKQKNVNIEITDYKQNEVYTTRFKSKRLDVVVSYKTQDNKDGVLITFSEDVKSYDPTQHNKLSNWLYDRRLKRDAEKELKKISDTIYARLTF